MHQFKVFIENVLKYLLTTNKGVRKFSFFMIGGTLAEKVGNRWFKLFLCIVLTGLCHLVLTHNLGLVGQVRLGS